MIALRFRSWGWLVVVIVLFGLVGSALGASASSARYKFFGPTLVNGLYQCSKQYSSVNNTSKTAYGFVEAYQGSACTTYYNRPAGYIGTIQTLVQGTSGGGGNVCGFRDWTYNSGTASAIGIAAFWVGPNPSCPSGVPYYASSKGRYWRADTGVYVTSSVLSNSPNLNF
jgi:hypothetical protein